MKRVHATGREQEKKRARDRKNPHILLLVMCVLIFIFRLRFLFPPLQTIGSVVVGADIVAAIHTELNTMTRQ